MYVLSGTKSQQNEKKQKTKTKHGLDKKKTS